MMGGQSAIDLEIYSYDFETDKIAKTMSEDGGNLVDIKISREDYQRVRGTI